MTTWLYEYATMHMSMHIREYRSYQLDIGSEAFKRVFVTHGNVVTTAIFDCDGREKEEMLKDDLEKNVTLCLHNSFNGNKETNVDPLICCKQRVEVLYCWRTASNSVRMATGVLQDTGIESA